ncbi:MAG: hypothetical protein QOG71_2126 [Pyrinomonadaceae bacterium]|nr:hypothetical protein [Pyrinomonadaceae bacterium]
MKKAPGETFGCFETTIPSRFEALVLIFDLEGFTQFCTKPQIERYIPRFLNRVFHLISSALVIDDSFNEARLRFPLGGALPVHIKFLGDGALLIWKMPTDSPKKVSTFIELLNHLYIVKTSYKDLLDECQDEFGISSLPNKIRFGIATGEVCKLKAGNPNRIEYIGFPINLASRLQSYCRGLGLMASARIGIDYDHLEVLNYRKVSAKKLSGFGSEVVIVDEEDYSSLLSKERSKLFSEV